MKISKHEMERREVVAIVKRAVLDAIEPVIATNEVTYAELIQALQEIQSRFIESTVVNEWREPE